MKCDFPIELLSGYIDNELDEKEKILVEDHLQTCPVCQQELEELKRLDSYLKTREIEEPSREFIFGLNRRVMERVRKKPRIKSIFVWRFTPIFVPVAAAVLVLIVLINTQPPTKIVGTDNRIYYSEIKIAEKTKALKSKTALPSTPKPAAAGSQVIAKEEGIIVETPSVVAEFDKPAQLAGASREEVIMDELAIPKDIIVRAIIDSTGRVLKVATGNTLVPERDTMLENRLEGQQLAPPTIRGKRTQLFVDLTETEKENH